MKKMLKGCMNLTFNETVILVIILLVALVELVTHIPTWKADYTFWRIGEYSQQGTMPINQSSLVIPKGQGMDACAGLKTLSGEPAFTHTIVMGGLHELYHCGCITTDSDELIKFKLLKDSIVYQCHSEILKTSKIPTSLEAK